MFGRVTAIALNTFREAVRARVLFGLFGLALATNAYSLVIAAMSLHQETRIISDIGSASISLYAVLVASVLGATSLYRELELKTVFPILTRELRRHEYVVGKYVGTVLTLAVFILVDGGAVLALLALHGGTSPTLVAGVVGGLLVVFGVLTFVLKHHRVYILLPWAIGLFIATALLASSAPDERRMMVASCSLSLAEVSIIAAVATLFSSFSSPYLTAMFTVCFFIVGRSTDSLANLPERVVGPTARTIGKALATVLPNLHTYVPPRPLLLGQVPGAPVWTHVGQGALNAAFYSLIIITASTLIFQKRDFL